MIKLPNIIWFYGQIPFRGAGNIFSGSFGSDPYYGCMNDNIYRYRVWLEKDENDEYILKAVYYKGDTSYDEADKESMQETIYEASDDGIQKAAEWIEKLHAGE